MNAIEKTLAILRALSTPGQARPLSTIAEMSGVHRATAHRILQVLVASNYAAPGGDGKYRAGPALYALGLSRDQNLLSAVTPLMEQLQLTTGQTVHFAVFTGRSASYVSKLEGSKPYRMASQVGAEISLFTTAIGKSVLAELPDEQRDELFVEARANNSVTEEQVQTLELELKTVRRQQYALDDEENEEGVRCIGTVVREFDGKPIGGISVSTLAQIVDRADLLKMTPTLIETADRMSALNGFDPNRG